MLCQQYYRKGRIDPANDTFNIDPKIVTGGWWGWRGPAQPSRSPRWVPGGLGGCWGGFLLHALDLRGTEGSSGVFGLP